MAKDLIGHTLAGYQILEKLGRGGMAMIYKAYQPSLDREVAIKILPPFYAEQDETFIERFKREATSIAKLEHQNILPVIDSGVEGDYFFIVMQYIRGGTLKGLMLRRALSLRHISVLMEQLANALDYAHAESVVHRDIQPSNILMRSEDWALLTDFGLAKIVDNSKLTQSGLTVGTPAYMSPEQGSGNKVDSRTDIYSLGVMLYEMVVGEVPYAAETPMAVVVKHITEPLPMPRDRNPYLPDDVQRIILKALAKDPVDRYQSAGEFSAALKIAAEGNPDWSSVSLEVPAVTTAAANDKTTLMQGGQDVDTVIVNESGTAAKQPNIWRTVTLIVTGLAMLLIGAFATMAIINWQQNQSVVVSPVPGGLQQPPVNGGQPIGAISLSELEVGVIPLPPGPPADRLNFINPWADGLNLLEDEEFQRANAAFYQALKENPARWGEFNGLVDDVFRDEGATVAADMMHLGLMAIGPEMATLEDIDFSAFLYHDSERYQFEAALIGYLMLIDPDNEDWYFVFYDAVSNSGQVQEGFAFMKRLEEENEPRPPAFFEVFGMLAEDIGSP